ncbi:hypothetical protein COE51_10810 [Bacillus pseudomycoides]|nr:hypothetical protein COE51_10810 [Bacillus pseudomycoides]
MFFFKKSLSPEEQAREGISLIKSVLGTYIDASVRGENPIIVDYNRTLDLQVHMQDFEEDNGDYTTILIYYGKKANSADAVASAIWSLDKGLEWNTYDYDPRYMNVIMAISNIEMIIKQYFVDLRDSLINASARDQPPLSEESTDDIINCVTHAFDVSQSEEQAAFASQNTNLVFEVVYNEAKWCQIFVFDQLNSQLIYEFHYKYGMYEVRVHTNNIHRQELFSYIQLLHLILQDMFEKSEKKSVEFE